MPTPARPADSYPIALAVDLELSEDRIDCAHELIHLVERVSRG